MKPTPEMSLESLSALTKALQQARPTGGKRLRWPMIGLAIAALLGATLLWTGSGAPSAGQFVTEEAKTTDLVMTASASGTLQPTKTVEVGSEMSGTLARVLVQENDRVKKGQLLAELDTGKLQDAVARSQAALAATEAKVAQAAATRAEAKATLARLQKVSELSGGKVPARSELDTAEATVLRAEASEASAKADVTQARAALKTDQTNLDKATIRSPVDGVVLSRKVEPGNTVAATMTTPVLFVIAEDLTQMELHVKVDEADVASVRVGQSASFTVSAWPGRTFPASIRRVGLGSTISDNVVTYKTILQVANADLALRPGMTATATIVTAKRDHALVVPNAALRFEPPSTATKASGSLVSNLLPRPPADNSRRASANPSGQRQVWVLDGAVLKAVPVQPGASNGQWTEILGGDLKPGMAVVTDYREAQK